MRYVGLYHHLPLGFVPGCFLFIVFWLIPIILGFTVIRADANRHSQPGWLWAVLTIPFGWFTILIYAVIRALMGAPQRG